MSAESTGMLRVDRDGALATVWFASPSGVNVFSTSVVRELGQHVASLASDESVRFVVFRGEGKTFVAGADIREMSSYEPAQGEAFSRLGREVFSAIESLPAITFAAINGHAMGGGCEIALACDFRIAASGARIGLPECRLGLIPGWGGTERMPRLVGPAKARRLMFSGEALTASAAHEIGLVDEVVADAAGMDEALARWRESFKPGSPAAVARIKHALRNGDEMQQFAKGFKTAQASEGMEAFLQKRPPSWAG